MVGADRQVWYFPVVTIKAANALAIASPSIDPERSPPLVSERYMSTLIPVILSGGSGTRLWPLSRTLRPKQFLEVTGHGTLFQQTLQRLKGLHPAGPIVVANQDHRFLAGEQCREVGLTPQAIILEPVGRNTAPAIAIAALAAQAAAAAGAAAAPGSASANGAASSHDPILLVLPSDHVIDQVPAFEAAMRVGLAAAESGKLVTFGIVPTHPETGYGYVKSATKPAAGTAAPVARFVEKPKLEVAEEYLREGSYLWNSGMFMFKASVFLAELSRHAPAMARACGLAWKDAKKDFEFVRLEAASFGACPSDSIDYAVMEKTDQAVVVPLDAGWSDVGAWPAVRDLQPQDAQGNATKGDVMLEDVQNSYVYADGRLVTLLGVDNLIVVETSDAVLVAHRDRAQDVKRVVDRLKADGRNEAMHHREVFRPWGSYDSVDNGERYQVKRISVRPGAKLSVQMHHHRAEHWIVVSGTAKVRIGETEQLVTENQSVYIPLGVVHSLENPGKLPLDLIEVQSGSYLGEDDIVRFEDRYGRA